MKTKTKGFTLIEILIVVGVLGLLLVVLVLTLNAKQKEIRDTSRLSDMQALRSALEIVKNEKGGYDQSYCDLTFTSLCAQKQSSELLRFMPRLKNLNDPKVLNVNCKDVNACQKTGCNYTFVTLNPDKYEVLFHLEKGVDGYGSAGCYMASEQGITKL